MKNRIQPLYYKSFSDYQESIDGRSAWFLSTAIDDILLKLDEIISVINTDYETATQNTLNTTNKNES